MKKICSFLILLVFSFFSINTFSQEKILIKGTVTDESDYEIPYAAVGIIKKNIGTTSSSEGTFSFLVTVNELDDFLEISSIGFETYKINVREYINIKNNKVVLKEKLTSLSEVVVKSPIFYVKSAQKKLKENTISSNHQLNMIYRRWSVEDNICRFYIEQYLNIIDRGPSSYVLKSNIQESRKSSEYRFIKNEQKVHAVQYMEWNNPLRKGLPINSFIWKKIENSSYDGEDVIVVEGKEKGKGTEILKLFIGYDTYKIYKIEMSKIPETGKWLTASYIYKKNSEGKLYLGYHIREWEGASRTPENVKKALINSGKKAPNFIPLAYRHEAFVIELIDNKKLFKGFEDMNQMDMSLYKIPYNENFWKNISLPAETNFFKENISELESLYGVPIETQFQYSN
tara:strand:- start:587 stop:1783 length:1197 start_codon:yes stop_codon:yes gene_type:complete